MTAERLQVRAAVDRETYLKLRRFARATSRPLADAAGALLEAAACDYDLGDDELPANPAGTEVR